MVEPGRAPGAGLTTSHYNFDAPVATGHLVYCAATGAVLLLRGEDAHELAHALTVPGCEIEVTSFPSSMLSKLLGGGFVVPQSFDELQQIRDRFASAIERAPVILTLTTTMDCNLGCYYCYEERSTDSLKLRDVEAVVALAGGLLDRNAKRSLHVDWYGGEPLLNMVFLEVASQALQDYCRERGIRYQASVISNGTRWPADVGQFVATHRIAQVQVSFDGMRRNHDKRRRYRHGRADRIGASSFDVLVDLVDRLLEHVRVDLRFNMDPENARDFVELLRFAQERGWFSKPFPAVVQPARLAAYSERSKFMRKRALSMEAFDALRSDLERVAGGAIPLQISNAPDAFPKPRDSVCSALATDSIVVGADRSTYRCGQQVSEPLRSVGSLGSVRDLPVTVESADDAWWRTFDPTAVPLCRGCSFLPICWGGCPKTHLEGDEGKIQEQCMFWRHNLLELVAKGTGHKLKGKGQLGESDQFRTQTGSNGACDSSAPAAIRNVRG